MVTETVLVILGFVLVIAVAILIGLSGKAKIHGRGKDQQARYDTGLDHYYEIRDRSSGLDAIRKVR